MKPVKNWRSLFSLLLFAVLSLVFPLNAPHAQDGFEWLPVGGCTILMSLNRADLFDILSSKKTEKEWAVFFAAAKLPEQQLNTLASYLAIYLPVDPKKLPNNPKKIDCAKLPIEGRTLVLENCQNCHSIGPIVMMDKGPVAWLNLMEALTHGEIKLKPKEMEAIAYYLTYNGAIPEEVIPEALNQPLQGY